MKESAALLWMVVMSGILNGIGQVTMRWGGRDAKIPFSFRNFGEWAGSSKWWILGLILTWVSGVLWAVLLRNVRLGIAFPLFAGTSYFLTIVGAFVVLSERPSTTQLVGMLLVMGGIALIMTPK